MNHYTTKTRIDADGKGTTRYWHPKTERMHAALPSPWQRSQVAKANARRTHTRTPSLPYTRKKQRMARATGQRSLSIKVRRASGVVGTQKQKQKKGRYPPAALSRPMETRTRTNIHRYPLAQVRVRAQRFGLSRVTPLPAVLPLPRLYRQLRQGLLEGGVRPYARHVLCDTPLLLRRDENGLQPALVHTHQAY